MFCFLAIQCSTDDLLIDNAQITFTTDTTSPYDYNTVATYSCSEGYYLIGQTSRTCLGDSLSVNGFTDTGVWSGSSPFCQRMS